MKRELKEMSKQRFDTMSNFDEFRLEGSGHKRNFKKLLDECSNLNAMMHRTQIILGNDGASAGGLKFKDRGEARTN